MAGDVGASQPGPQTASTASSDVFVSYASQDASVANAMVKYLEKRGIKCWIAPRDVRAGAQYADAIVRAIADAKTLVLVLSEHAIASSHVSREIERASSKKHPIIALRIDAAPLIPAFEYFLGESQWVEAQTGKMEAAYARLIEAIREPERPVSTVLAPAPLPAPAGKVARPQGGPNRTRLLLATGVGILALAFAAVWANRIWQAKRATAEKTRTSALYVGSDKSIAVLPFVDMSEKKDQEYFAGGMAEEILNLLAKIPDLKVIGRTSSFQFKGQGEDPRAVGAKLNVAYVLEGSVRKSGDRVRVTAQLIDTRTEAHQWSGTFERQVGDVLKMQDEIAAGVAVALAATFAADDAAARRELANPQAYDLYLRGLHAEIRFDRAGFEEAAGYYRQSLELDPSFLPAVYAMGSVYFEQAAWAFVPPREGFPRARSAFASALKLDTRPGGSTHSRAQAHATLAYINVMYDWNWAAAEAELQQALALAPHDSFVLDVGAEVKSATGQWDDALRYGTLAIAQNPLSAPSYENFAMARYRSGRLADAEVAMRRALELSPSYTAGHYYLTCILIAQGRPEEALAEIQREIPDGGRYIGLAIAYSALSRKPASDKALAQALVENADLLAYHIAGAYAYRGELDSAIAWLDRAYRQKDPELYRLKGNPLFKKLENDPRYKAFLRKLNLPE